VGELFLVREPERCIVVIIIIILVLPVLLVFLVVLEGDLRNRPPTLDAAHFGPEP
jgi:hypothetical protein